MRRIVLWAAICFAALSVSAAPRLTFVRTVRPPHELGGEVVSLIYAIGDNRQVDTYVDTFSQHVNRSDLIRLTVAIDRHHHEIGAQLNPEAFTRLRRQHPADAYVGVNRFTCSSEEKHGVGHVYSPEGVRMVRAFVWVEAVCSARLDIIDAATGSRTGSLETRGEGTSPHVALIRDEETNGALWDAARMAAISAAEMVTPRRVRESIELDETVPAFREGYALIDASRLTDARATWEAALRSDSGIAGLHYNVAAVCEALGDLAAARQHYEQAQRLAPQNARYREELTMFRSRARK